MTDKAKDVIVAVKMDAAANETVAMPSSNSETAPPLELGWTQIRRKRLRVDKNSKEPISSTPIDNAADDGDCIDCTDPSCRRKISVSFQQPDLTTASSTNKSFKGRVVWLLHDVESEWFQGYMFLPGQSRPWGLLALVQELDECLQCAEGGYRQIRLQVHLPKDSADKRDSSEKKDLGIVEWTGGDMMRLESVAVRMDPEKVVTGEKAASIAVNLFKGVWKQLCAMHTSSQDMLDDNILSLLDLLPDVAVVYGKMELDLPTRDE